MITRGFYRIWVESGESLLNFILFCGLFRIETENCANTVQCGVVLSDMLVVTEAELDTSLLYKRFDGVLKALITLLQCVP